jgi:hypothetical protein
MPWPVATLSEACSIPAVSIQAVQSSNPSNIEGDDSECCEPEPCLGDTGDRPGDDCGGGARGEEGRGLRCGDGCPDPGGMEGRGLLWRLELDPFLLDARFGRD